MCDNVYGSVRDCVGQGTTSFACPTIYTCILRENWCCIWIISCTYLYVRRCTGQAPQKRDLLQCVFLILNRSLYPSTSFRCTLRNQLQVQVQLHYDCLCAEVVVPRTYRQIRGRSERVGNGWYRKLLWLCILTIECVFFTRWTVFLPVDILVAKKGS